MFDKLAYYAFFLWILVSELFNISDKLFIFGIYIIGLVLVVIISYDYFNHKKFGKIYYYTNYPKPFTSMVTGLNKNNIFLKDVSKILFVSYDLKETCKYLVPLLKKIDKEIDIELIGYGNVKCNQSNIKLIQTKQRLKEHKNLIFLKNGDVFLWYEPYHVIQNSKHYFKNGAYLIKLNNKQLEKIKLELEKFEVEI